MSKREAQQNAPTRAAVVSTTFLRSLYSAQVEDEMFRRILDTFFASRRPSVRLVPSSERLPQLWRQPERGHPVPDLLVLRDADTDVLKSLCDQYWNSFLEDFDDDTVIRDSRICQSALDLLVDRAPEVISWACQRLNHPGYDARESAAWLLGRLAENGRLGSSEGVVAHELAALATRCWEEDTKEIVANAVALRSLQKIGGPVCIETARRILLSPEWDDDDLQWDAAEVLAAATGERFMEADDPVQTSKEWSRTR